MSVTDAVRKSMRNNKRRDTKLELLVRSRLFAEGLRGYRVDVGSLPGRPDIVFHRARVAIFVNGCFWHGCPYCTRNITPSSNAEFWNNKLRQTKERDARSRQALEELGFRVITLWGCQIHADCTASVERVRQSVDMGKSTAITRSPGAT